MQNQVYARYLYQMLMKSGKVSLPSLGSFLLDYHESKFAQHKTTLLPPSTEITFSPSFFPESAFRNLLVESGMLETDATHLEALLIDDYVAAQNAGIPFDLGGLGSIVNGQFIPSNPDYFNKYYGLSEIKIAPKVSDVKSIKHDEDYLYRLKTTNTADKSSSFKDLLLPAIIGLITLFVILFWMLNSDDEPQKVLTQNESSIAVVDSTIDQTQKNIADSLRIERELAKMDSLALVEEMKKEEPLTAVEPKVEQAVEIKEKISEPKTDSDQPCVIVVGAFKNAGNVKLMKKKIAAKGYKSFSSSFNGLTRVGVVYNCNQTDPEKFKSKVQKIFNADAWNLHDTI